MDWGVWVGMDCVVCLGLLAWMRDVIWLIWIGASFDGLVWIGWVMLCVWVGLCLFGLARDCWVG